MANYFSGRCTDVDPGLIRADKRRAQKSSFLVFPTPGLWGTLALLPSSRRDAADGILLPRTGYSPVFHGDRKNESRSC